MMSDSPKTGPTFLYTSDLHVTSKPADQYRWKIFDWLLTAIDRYEVDVLFILGDLTDEKDEHKSTLVNRLTNHITDLAKKIPIYILKGNHDYTDISSPFFRFLDYIPNVTFVSQIKVITIAGKCCCFLPHTRNWEHDWKKVDWIRFQRAFFHQTFKGAMSASGRLDLGPPVTLLNCLRNDAIAVSGDIHVPQVLGPLVYVGSPHVVNFGDTFQPRVLLDQNGQLRSIKQYNIKKATVVADSVKGVKTTPLTEGDQLRVTLELPRSRFGEFAKAKEDIVQWAKELKVDVASVELKEAAGTVEQVVKSDALPSTTKTDIFKRFCEEKGINLELVEIGEQLLERE